MHPRHQRGHGRKSLQRVYRVLNVSNRSHALARCTALGVAAYRGGVAPVSSLATASASASRRAPSARNDSALLSMMRNPWHACGSQSATGVRLALAASAVAGVVAAAGAASKLPPHAVRLARQSSART